MKKRVVVLLSPVQEDWLNELMAHTGFSASVLLQLALVEKYQRDLPRSAKQHALSL